jgi:hypothetical protein
VFAVAAAPGRPKRHEGRGEYGYAAASQYPELNGLLIRSASGDTSINLSVGIFSLVGSPDGTSMPETAEEPFC